MSYLVAKKYADIGCYAVQAESGKELAQLVVSLGEELMDRDVQIFIVSDPEVFGEYKPYRMVSCVGELIRKARQM